jgi:hypothetical protein
MDATRDKVPQKMKNEQRNSQENWRGVPRLVKYSEIEQRFLLTQWIHLS